MFSGIKEKQCSPLCGKALSLEKQTRKEGKKREHERINE